MKSAEVPSVCVCMRTLQHVLVQTAVCNRSSKCSAQPQCCTFGMPGCRDSRSAWPHTQVMHAAEQALRQLQVSDVERNAILEAFRYKEAKMAAAVKEANARADAVVEEAAAKVVEVGATPFTRCVPSLCKIP